VVVVTGTGPDVANLLGLQVLGLKGEAVQRWRGQLQNRQGRRRIYQGLIPSGERLLTGAAAGEAAALATSWLARTRATLEKIMVG
jgi:hypothetical protein